MNLKENREGNMGVNGEKMWKGDMMEIKHSLKIKETNKHPRTVYDGGKRKTNFHNNI